MVRISDDTVKGITLAYLSTGITLVACVGYTIAAMSYTMVYPIDDMP